MSTNQKAIAYYVEGEFEKAFEFFQKATLEKRTVQSLHNLAFFYLYEKEDKQKAKELLEEAIQLKPISYFPYNLLGEVYIQFEMWEEASQMLEEAIIIKPNRQAYFNLALCYYRMNNKEKAVPHFLKASNGSDYARYLFVKSMIDIGEIKKAERELDNFSEDDEEFVGEVEVAELYAMIGNYEKAIKWFEKGLDVYSKSEDWLSNYAYSLVRLGRVQEAENMIQKVVIEIEQDVEEVSLDFEFTEYWNEEDKKDCIQSLTEEKEQISGIMDKISDEFKVQINMDLSAAWFIGCYLFGCTKCGHSEYEE